MHKIIKWFVENIVAANLLMVLVLTAGLVTIPRIMMEIFPIALPDVVTVSIVYPGASPEEVEKSITSKVEEKIQGIESIKKISSISSENLSLINIELLPGQDISKSLDIIKTQVDGMTSLPEEAENPIVNQFSIESKVISVAVSGDIDEYSLTNLARSIQDEIILLDDVTLTSIDGIISKEIAIELSDKQLRKYNISFSDVVNAVKRSSIDLPGGKIETTRGEILIRTEGQALSGSDYSKISLITKSDGTRLRIGDVANVKDGFQDLGAKIYFNGNPSKIINVYRVGNQNALDISKSVRNYINMKNQTLPEKISLTTWDDESRLLKGRIDLLLKNARMGLILVVIVLALFLKPKLAFWVSIGIPISFMGALSMLPGLDVSINLLSLFTFILVLGIVVDDAIIVGENIYRHREKGIDPHLAATEGAHEVGVPVVFAVLTTMATFSPMLFVDGYVGRIWRIIPLVVMPTLVWSLIESLTILPSHLAHMKERKSKLLFFEYISKIWTRIQNKINIRLKNFINNKYIPLLKKSLKNPPLTISIFMFLLLVNLGIIGGGWLKFSFFPPIESDSIKANIVFPEGTPVEVTESAIKRLENAAFETKNYFIEKSDANKNLFKNILSNIGFGKISQTNRSEPPGSNTGISTINSNQGQIIIELAPGETRSMPIQDIVNKWRENTGNILGTKELVFESSIFSSGEPINIQLSGPSLFELQNVVGDVKEHLSNYSGVFDITDSYSSGKQEIKVSLLPEAENYGINNFILAKQIRQAFYGEEIQTIQRGKDEIKVVVRYPKSSRESLSNLDDLPLQSPDGREIPFKLVAQTDLSTGAPSILRINRNRSISITADVDPSAGNANMILEDLSSNYFPKKLKSHPLVSYSFEGEQREQNDNLISLGYNYLIALLVVYILLAIPFKSYLQPLIVMTAIPYGIIGAIFGHLIFGMNFTILSMIGMVALSGVVVNDSLVLVDFINRFRKKGYSAYEAALEAGPTRFRAVVLTSFTTFVGLLPLLLEKSVQAQFLIPMAISLGFGVMFSTLITLILVPNSYLYLESLKKKLSSNN